jgi:hypothetical protein
MLRGQILFILLKWPPWYDNHCVYGPVDSSLYSSLKYSNYDTDTEYLLVIY